MLPALRHAFAIAAWAGLAWESAAASPAKVWVVLRDKGPAAPAPPASAPPASARAFEDRPVYAPYLAALARASFAVDVALKWQNRVSGRIEPARVPVLRGLPWVAAVEPMPRRARRSPFLPRGPMPFRPWAKRSAGTDFGAIAPLFDTVGVTRLHRWMTAAGKPPGQGLTIALVDADFHLGSAIFAPLKPRIRDQWDFAGHKPRSVDDSLLDSHGAECLSLIGGNAPGTLAGAAPGASFLLYRAEIDDSEQYAEEDYVAAALERAVDSGAQVVNVSLGYRYDFDSQPDIPYTAFDGRTRPASKAALMAARRDVLVSVAMGNEGGPDPAEATLGTPADADSVLSVGIADRSGHRCSYSSTGPTADGRVKPEVVSMGIVNGCSVPVAYPETASAAVAYYSGTSFAAPVVAGICALLRQLRPDAPAEAIRQALIRTAGHPDHPDNETGYGLVDAAAAALRLGVPLGSDLAENGHARLFHPNGDGPILIPWDPERPRPALELIDLAGRRMPIAVSLEGALLTVKPGKRLATGVFVARIP